MQFPGRSSRYLAVEVKNRTLSGGRKKVKPDIVVHRRDSSGKSGSRAPGLQGLLSTINQQPDDTYASAGFESRAHHLDLNIATERPANAGQNLLLQE